MRLPLLATALLAILSIATFVLMPEKDRADALSTSSSIRARHDVTHVDTPEPATEQKRYSAPAQFSDLDRRHEFLARLGADPRAAVEWLLALPVELGRPIADDPLVRQALSAAADRLVQSNESAAMTLQDFIPQWALLDVDAVRNWTQRQPAGDARNAIISRAAYALSQNSPAEAAEWVAEEMSPGPAQVEAAICVLHQWAIRDFPSARAWAERFPDGVLRDRALGELNGLAFYLGSATSGN